MANIEIPKYKSLLTDITGEVIRNKIRKDSALNTVGPIDGLLKKYQQLSGKLVVGRSQIGIGDLFEYGELLRSERLEDIFTKIGEDLKILYAEANNIDRYLYLLRGILKSSIDTSVRYINALRDETIDFIDLDVNNSFFTDVVTNPFNSTSNRTNHVSPALIDTDSERLKLKPITTYEWGGYYKNRVNFDLFSKGIEIVEEGDRKDVFSEDRTRPWYVALVGERPINNKVKGISYSDYDGVIVGLQLGFDVIRPINQIKIVPFSTAKLELLDIMYSEVDTPKNWNRLNLGQSQSTDLLYEYNFRRIFAREIMLVFGQRSFIQLDDAYTEADTRLSVEHIVANEIVKYVPDVNSFRLMNKLPDRYPTPFVDFVNDILKRITTPRIRNPQDKLREYIIGVNQVEVNYHEYSGAGIYESDTIQADGNIIEVQMQEQSVVHFENNILNSVITHDLKIGGNEYAVGVLDDDGFLLDANYILVDNNNNKYTYTRFLVEDIDAVKLYYNGVELNPNTYIVSPTVANEGHYIEFLNDLVIPNDVVGMRYRPPSTEPNGLIYYPHIFNARRRIGVPNLNIKEGSYIVTDDAYVFPTQQPYTETGTASIAGLVLQVNLPTINYYPGQKLYITDTDFVPNSKYCIVKQVVQPGIVYDVEVLLDDVTGLTPGTVTVEQSGDPDYTNPIAYHKEQWELVFVNGVRYLEISAANVKYFSGIDTGEYDYTFHYAPNPLESIHSVPGFLYIPEPYFVLPNRGLYFGVLNEKHVLPVNKILTLGDPAATNFDVVGGYKLDSVIVKYNGLTSNQFSQYPNDTDGGIQNKTELEITDPTILPGTIIDVSYIPINPGYVTTNPTAFPLQSTNLRPPNIFETFTGVDDNRSVTINNVPFVDNKIVGDTFNWTLTRGVFSLKNNVSVTYEPVIVYINNRKVINYTDYYGGENPTLELTTSLIETGYTISGNIITFNREIGSTEVIRVEYYEMSGEIAVINRLFRIDGTSIDITPELYSYTLLVDVRK